MSSESCDGEKVCRICHLSSLVVDVKMNSALHIFTVLRSGLS